MAFWRGSLRAVAPALRIGPRSSANGCGGTFDYHTGMLGWAADYPDPDSFSRASPGLYLTEWQNDGYCELVENGRRRSTSGRPEKQRNADLTE